MAWNYLSQFWDAVAEVVIGGTTYTIAWFESIGNAVAGAIGGLFDDLIHHIYDVFLISYWFVDNLGGLFNSIFAPIFWVFSFSKGFITSATSSLLDLGLSLPEFEIYNENVSSFFSAIPYFSQLMAGGGALIGLFFVILIIKKASTI